MANQAARYIHGDVLRVTRLDACGAPLPGPKSRLVTEGFVSVTAKPVFVDGEELVQKDAAGRIKIYEPGRRQRKNWDLDISTLDTDPELDNFLTGDEIIVDREGDAVGTGFDDTETVNFALEVWTNLAGKACAGVRPYGYYVFPWVTECASGDQSIQEQSEAPTYTAKTKPGNSWGAGPYDVTLHDGALPADPGVPGPLLAAIPVRRQVHRQIVTVAPPAVTNGAVVFPAP